MLVLVTITLVCAVGEVLAINTTECGFSQNTDNCILDMLLISRSGDETLAGAQFYCSNVTFTAVSIEQRITIGLLTSNNSPGGRFLCGLYAQEKVPTTLNCSSGYSSSTRIVGGRDTGINEFPMMAGLVNRRQYQTMNQTVIFCGGVIISKTYIMTAAHCVDNMPQYDILIIVGARNLSSANETIQRLQVMEMTIHRDYNSESASSKRSNNEYDIAILKTDGNINFSKVVGPVCLPFNFQDTNFRGSRVTILGWGTTSASGPTSDVLQKVNVDVISRSQCLILNQLQRGHGRVTRKQICTYTRGRDACQFDSGGPLLYTDPSTGLLFSIGIVNSGRFCAERLAPAVNTNVPRLLDWIIANTPDADFFRK